LNQSWQEQLTSKSIDIYMSEMKQSQEKKNGDMCKQVLVTSLSLRYQSIYYIVPASNPPNNDLDSGHESSSLAFVGSG
jgi:hypothetical protein